MTTWILLRGLARGSRHWGEFLPIFERIAGRIACVDFPGNGRACGMASFTTVKDMTAYCRDVLAKSGVCPPYFLLALSLGGMVAVEWLHGFPRDISGCVLINTSLRGLSPFYRRLRPASVWALLHLAFQSDAREREEAIYDLTSNLPERRNRIVAAWAETAVRHPVRRANLLRQLIAAGRYRLPDAGPSCPVLALCSACDRLVDPDCSMRLADRWGASLAVHPQAGHDLTLDDPSWAACQVSHWLQENFPRRGRAV